MFRRKKNKGFATQKWFHSSSDFSRRLCSFFPLTLFFPPQMVNQPRCCPLINSGCKCVVSPSCPNYIKRWQQVEIQNSHVVLMTFHPFISLMVHRNMYGQWRQRSYNSKSKKNMHQEVICCINLLSETIWRKTIDSSALVFSNPLTFLINASSDFLSS